LDSLVYLNRYIQKVICFTHTKNQYQKKKKKKTLRIGTLLELVRYIAIKIAEQNLRVRICVQGSMGSGIFTSLPKQLSGVATLLERMDWQSGVGEENEGIIGTYVKFGAIGKEHVVNTSVKEGVIGDDVFIILCPQNMVGTDTSVIPILQEMVEAAGDRPVILINPSLADKVSSGGQQSFRGRQERLDFCNSFQSIFHMECLYMSGTSYFPIVGALTKLSPSSPWVAYQRRDLLNNEGEVYIPVLCAELRPSSDMILSCFES
jgi:adenylate kinase